MLEVSEFGVQRYYYFNDYDLINIVIKYVSLDVLWILKMLQNVFKVNYPPSSHLICV